MNTITIDKPESSFKAAIRRFLNFYWIRNIYYSCKMRFLYQHYIVKTSLNPWGWHDTDERLLYASMDLLIQFIDNEHPFETCEWEHDADHSKAGKTIKQIEAWWRNYPKRQKEIDKMLTVWHNEYVKKNNKHIKNGNKEEILSKKLHNMEVKLKNEEKEMLKKLIDVRDYLWT